MNIQLQNPTAKYRRTRKGVLTNIYSKQVERSRRKNMPLPAYSLQEFHDKYLNDKKFIRLFNEWVEHNYLKAKKPSFDRIDCMKPYSFENIHIVTWEENRYKQRFEVKRIRATTIKATNIKTGEETFYTSVSDAVNKTGLHQGCISSCLTGLNKTYKGYFWTYVGKPKRKLKPHTRKCERCGREFIYKNKSQKFCSPSCGSKGNKNASKCRDILTKPSLSL